MTNANQAVELMEAGVKTALTKHGVGPWICCRVLVSRRTNGDPKTDTWMVEGRQCIGIEETWAAIKNELLDVFSVLDQIT